jgi:hypothetical protein
MLTKSIPAAMILFATAFSPLLEASAAGSSIQRDDIVLTSDMDWMNESLQTENNKIFIDVSNHFPYLSNGALTVAAASSNTAVLSADGNASFLILTINGAGNAIVTINAHDEHNVTVSDQFHVSINKLGDGTGDGILSPADAFFVYQVIQGKAAINELQKRALDMNQDGEITAADASLIMLSYTGQSTGGSTNYEYIISMSNKNDRPQLVQAVTDQTAALNTSFSYMLPSTAFIDADEEDSLQYDAGQADGSPLPPWLTFHADTRTFEGIPQTAGTASIKVVVRDEFNETAEAVFNIVTSLNNIPPIVANPLIQEYIVAPGVPGTPKVSLASVFTDPDGDPFSISASPADNRVANGTMNGNELLIEPGGVKGRTTIKVIADDGKETTDFNVNVRAVELVPNGLVNITTKKGIESVTVDLAQYFILNGGENFTVVRNHEQMPLLGSKWTIPLDDGAAGHYWIISDDHRAVYVTINIEEQSGSNIYFSEYLDAGNGRAALEIYYKETNHSPLSLHGYEIEVYQYLKNRHEVSTHTIPLGGYPLYSGRTYHLINHTFYDFFDFMNTQYYNEEGRLTGLGMETIAYVLKKNGQVVDVIGIPTKDPSKATPIFTNGGTMVRKKGNQTGSIYYNLTGEWDLYPKDTFQHYGNHTP